MKTNEDLKRQLVAQAETAIEYPMDQLQEVKDGDLSQLEDLILQTVMELGRKEMESLLGHAARQATPSEPPESTCGHGLQLVSYRERQILTLMGRLRIRRAYYHCEENKQRHKKEAALEVCAGVAPFDQQWGLTQSQSSPGLQRVLAKLSARLTHEEVAETIEDLLPVRMSARQVGSVIQPIGEAFLLQEDQQMREILQQGGEKRLSERLKQEEQGPGIGRLYYALARQAGLLRAQQVVIVGDGAKWIWNLANEQFQGAVQIVDEYHAKEHVWEVARAAFAAEADLRDSWAHQVLDLLSQGRIEEVIAAIEKLSPLSPLQARRRAWQRRKPSISAPTSSACAIPTSAHRGCTWAVGSPKPPAKPW